MNKSIGELEELVLLAAGSIYHDAYALNILEVIKQHSQRNPDVTAIHSVLRRLEKKGYLKSKMGGATAERGGRRKRFFSLTQSGKMVLDNIMEVRLTLYNKIPPINLSGN